jgi:hypothetical protein
MKKVGAPNTPRETASSVAALSLSFTSGFPIAASIAAGSKPAARNTPAITIGSSMRF